MEIKYTKKRCEELGWIFFTYEKEVQAVRHYSGDERIELVFKTLRGCLEKIALLEEGQP